MMNRTRIDFSLIAIAALLVFQASIASYGIRLVRDVAIGTHAELVSIAHTVQR
jgi:hypothetical protein